MHAEHPITSHLVLAELLVYAHAEVESELAPPSADEVDAGWEGLHVGHGGRLGHLVGIWFPADNERVQQRHRAVVVRQLRSVEGSRQQHHRCFLERGCLLSQELLRIEQERLGLSRLLLQCALLLQISVDLARVNFSGQKAGRGECVLASSTPPQ